MYIVFFRQLIIIMNHCMLLWLATSTTMTERHEFVWNPFCIFLIIILASFSALYAWLAKKA